MPNAALSPDEFAAAVAAVTTAFGDPTRRDIYLYVRGRAERRDRRRGRRALRPAPQRRPPPPREARGRRLPRRRARPPRIAPADRRSGTAPPPTTRISRSRPAATTCSPPCSPARSSALPVEEARDDRRTRSGSSTAGRWPHGWNPREGHRSVKAAVASVADALTAHGFAAHAETQRQRAHPRRRALPVRRGRSPVPARVVRGRHRHGQGDARRALRRNRADLSSRVVRTATTTASPASEAVRLRARVPRSRIVIAAAPGRRSTRCSRSSAIITPIPAASTRRAARRGSRSKTAREQVAAFFGARPREVVFTASGTESVNTRGLGRTGTGFATAGHVVTTAVEHSSVRDAIARAGMRRHARRRRPLRPVRSRRGARRDRTTTPHVVSVQLANHEVGTLQPVADVAAARARPRGARPRRRVRGGRARRGRLSRARRRPLLGHRPQARRPEGRGRAARAARTPSRSIRRRRRAGARPAGGDRRRSRVGRVRRRVRERGPAG